MPDTPFRPAASAWASKPVKGVFSVDAARYLGSKGFGLAKAQKVFVYAEEREPGRVTIQRLSRNFIPSGPRRVLDRERLLAEYLPEPTIYINKVVPVMRHLEETVSAADRHRERQELFSAEFEYKNVLRVSEEHVRATFGLGLTYLERREKQNADVVFRKLMHLEAAFTTEHKHLFNEFGIQMRKLGMYAEAMQYYGRAYRLCKTDEHLLYNMARTLYERGRLRSSRVMLDKALRLNAAFPEGRAFLAFLDAKARGEAAPELPAD